MVMLIYKSIFKIIATVNDIVFNKKPVLYNVFKKKNQQQERKPFSEIQPISISSN